MRPAACVAVLLLALLGTAAALTCPDTPKYNGCKTEGCLGIPTGRRTMDVVCDACGEGYILAFKGTKSATCECAPGWAGRGNNGVCIKCPEGTQIATGGPIGLSACLSCPENTLWSERSQECLCPAGTQFERDASKGQGWKHVNCRPCTGKNEYMDLNMHDRRQCKICPAALVPTTDRTACVPVNHPEAFIPVGPIEQVMGKLAALNPFAPKNDKNDKGDKGDTAARTSDKSHPDFAHLLAELVTKWADSKEPPAAAAEPSPTAAKAAPVAATIAAVQDAPKADAPKAPSA